MAELLLAMVFGFALGLATAIRPEWVVIVRGDDDGILMVEYKKRLYRLNREQ